MRYLPLLLAVAGILLLCGFHLPKWDIRAKFRGVAEHVEKIREEKKTDATAKEYVARIDGRTKQPPLKKAYTEARQVYYTIGQQSKYQQTLQTALICGVIGAAAGLAVFRNVMLAVVLAVGLYLLPLWLSQFALYHYDKFLSSELETALSLVTTSYLRNDDILASVEENINHMKNPVRASFSNFCNTVKYIDANAPAAIEKLKASLDNTLFHQWCDALILCQENHLLQAALPAIVSKFSDLKAQQAANETRMMLPLRQAISMIVLVGCFVPLMYLVNRDWYDYLISTFFGQIALTLTALAMFAALHKAIKLSKPITYDV